MVSPEKQFSKTNKKQCGLFRSDLDAEWNSISKVHSRSVNKISVDHINKIRTDNRLCNLRWATKVEQQQNRGMMPTNTSGHICVSRHHDGVYWIYKKVYNHKNYSKTSKNLSTVLCYKFITILKIKVLMR